MKPFSLERIRDDKDLQAIDSFSSSRFLAGGTNLVDLMKHQIESPDQLVDLSQWQTGTQIQETDSQYVIEAMVSNTELANFAYTRPDLSLLAQALLSGATVQLRNRATTAGNLLQRTRCYYFYDRSKPCNKREPDSGCAAIDGFNRNHAILGTSEKCIASHPSDMAVAMVALDASVGTTTKQGQTRHIPVRELHHLPGFTPHIETQLADDELITHVHIPRHNRGSHLYRKVRDRSSYAFALVSVACTLKLNNNVVEDVQLAFGGVGTKPWYAEKARQILLNQEVTDALIKQAAMAELADAKAFAHNGFKLELLEKTVGDVLSTLTEHQRNHPQQEGAIYAK